MNITKWNFSIDSITKSGNVLLVENRTLQKVLLPKKLVKSFFNDNTKEFVAVQANWKGYENLIIIEPKQIPHIF